MARLELDPVISETSDQASACLWQAWLSESPAAARAALSEAQKLDHDNEIISAGLTFVQGLLDWQPAAEADCDQPDCDQADPSAVEHTEPSAESETIDEVEPSVEIESAVETESAANVESATELEPERMPDVEIAQEVDSEKEFELAEGVQFVPVVEAESELLTEIDSITAAEPIGRIVDTGATKPLILAVDESRIMRKLVSLALTSAGYEVMTASDGVDALNKIAKRVPALVLSDIKMTKLGGFQLCKLLKKDQRTRSIPVVMLSDKESAISKWKGSLVGCQDYVVKPFQSQILIGTVDKHIDADRESEQSLTN